MKQITNWIKWISYCRNSSGTSTEWGWSSGWSCGVYGLSDQLIRAAIRSIINESQWTHFDVFPHYKPPVSLLLPAGPLIPLFHSPLLCIHCHTPRQVIIPSHPSCAREESRVVGGRARSGRTWGRGGREPGSLEASTQQQKSERHHSITVTILYCVYSLAFNPFIAYIHTTSSLPSPLLSSAKLLCGGISKIHAWDGDWDFKLFFLVPFSFVLWSICVLI